MLVSGTSELGYNVIINNQYSGVFYHNAVLRILELGEETAGYIRKIRPDGKIDVSLQKAGFAEVKDASQEIMDKLKTAGGTLNLSDSSDPHAIYSALGMSKKTFKKAIGTLYREGKISILPEQINLLSKE